jgi:predicted dehydrogenase
MKQAKGMSRRRLLGTAAATLATTIVPRHVLGGAGHVAPSEKLNIGYIGCGTQGLREMVRLIQDPHVRITSVCDPNLFTTDYVDWSLHGIRNGIRQVLEDPNWGSGLDGIPGGRRVGQEVVEKYYAKEQGAGSYKGCASYADFRELLEKETDLDAVKVMTPDHLHAAVSIAAMNKGKHVVIHKPIANRLHEARLTIETARATGARTHLLAWSKRSGYDHALRWIKDGAIGKLRVIHNWSNRPVWPQWTSNPSETVPLPEGLDWPLWLGPVPDRPYHPNYTHAVFRGWYDFGAGAIADMGTYSLWPLFLAFGFNTPPTSVEANGTTTCAIENHVSRPVTNDVAFPHSCVVRFKFPSQGEWDAFEIHWHDGGMRPELPEALAARNEELPREGMMFVGDEGKIVAGFRCESPRLLPERRMIEVTGSVEPPEEVWDRSEGNWIEAFRNDVESPGTFLKAGPVTETILLGGAALRARRRIVYDAAGAEITNYPEANAFLTRSAYRPGWAL